jgi:hypothetical protein
MNAWFTENWPLIKDLITIVLSVAAIIVSIWAIRKSRKVEKKQEEFLGIQIKEHHRQEQDRKKADPYGEINKIGLKSWQLIISNLGPAAARNLTFELPSDLSEKGVLFMEKISSTTISLLESKKYVTFHVMLFAGHAKAINVTYRWDDDFMKGQEKEGSIFINV